MANDLINKAKDVADRLFDFPEIDSDLEVWFTFEGRDYEVAQFSINFGQGVDFKGQPQDEIRGGRILLTLSEAVPEEIYKWAMISCVRNGSVEFRSKTANAPLKVEFMNAYCVQFNRTTEYKGGLRTTLSISPKELTVNSITINNRWV
jgi:hypothetical protein